MDEDKQYSVVPLDEEPINFREIIFRYLHHWKWFVISVLAFVILGFAYIKLTIPQFQIETDLLIKQDKNNASLGGGDDILKSLDLFSSNKIIDNEVEILKSYTLFEKVAKALGLEVSFYANGTFRKYPAYKNLPFKIELLKPVKTSYDSYLNVDISSKREVKINGKRIQENTPFFDPGFGLMQLTLSRQIDSPYLNNRTYIKFNKLARFYQDYSNILNITPVSKEGTTLIITYQDPIPERGIDILDTLVLEYNNAAVQDKNRMASSTLAFINERLIKLQGELGVAESNVEKYKSANNITNIGAQSQVFMQSVQQNDAELNKVNIQLSVLQNLVDYIHTSNNNQAQLPSMLAVSDPTLLGLVNQLGVVLLRRESFLQTVQVTNPLVHSLDDQIKALKSAIEQSVQNLKTGLITTRDQLAKKDSYFESIIKQIPSKEHGLLDVMREQGIKDTLFNFLLQKREEQAMALASNLPDSRTIDVARSTDKPVKPVIPLVLGLFFVVGLVVPVGVIYVRGLLNNKVNKRSDIEWLTSIPIVAEIAHSDDNSPLITVEKPRSMIAEQIRALRTNLQFISTDRDHKVLLFTSGVSGEGKSFVSVNLGASLALSGKKVVILEFDLRKPKLHIALGMENQEGLSKYLISNINYKSIIKEVPQQRDYFIITSGQIPPNPAELLTNGRLEGLIADLKKDFDFVIIDAPPIGLVTDAQILGKLSDATMFIIRHNYTLKSQVAYLDELYRNRKLPNMNIVFNSIDYSASYGYGYGYGYGYSGGYYTEDVKKSSFFGRIFKRNDK